MKTVHLKFSIEELEEIDDWKNERRIRTRSEAIRRLIRDSLANCEKQERIPPRIVQESAGFNDSLIKNTVRNVIAEDTSITSMKIMRRLIQSRNGLLGLSQFFDDLDGNILHRKGRRPDTVDSDVINGSPSKTKTRLATEATTERISTRSRMSTNVTTT